MAASGGRPRGAVGITRKIFETDFFEYCSQNDFSPGFECARMMDRAAKDEDVRTFVQLLAIYGRMVQPQEIEQAAQGGLPLVIDRTRVAA